MNQKSMLYVHIPFCMQKCRYCDFLSFPASEENRQLYIDALCKEMDAWKGRETGCISSLFIGGGTPSLLTPNQMEQVMAALHRNFHIEKDAEQTIEVNPGTITEEKAKCWKQKGINRVSMGVQALDDQLLKCLGRIHNHRQVLESWEILRKYEFQNLSFDLMMGLPDQSLIQWEQTLHEAVQLKPQHLSCYSLIIEEGTPFYDEQESLRLPEEETERLMYLRTQEILSDAGMYQYEISNFSLPGFESKHNTGYWRRQPYIGLGLGAASLLKEEIRYHNTNDMEHYLRCSGDLMAIREDQVELSLKDQMEEFMFLGLRCTQGVQREEFLRNFGNTLESIYGKVLEKHMQTGLLESKDGWIRLTQAGLNVANQVFVDFLLDA